MSDSFPSNSNNTNINCNVTIINSEFNSEIVNQLISSTENRLKEIRIELDKLTEDCFQDSYPSYISNGLSLSLIHI